MNEEITLRLETFNNKEYILADDCIKTIGIHRKTNSKLHEEIKRLKEEYMILQNASDERENELIAESTKWESKFYDEAKKVDKAIEYIENNFISYEDSRAFGQLGEEIDIQVKEIRELLNILKGSE